MNAIEEKVLELIGESTSSPDVFTDDEEGMAPIRDSINDAIAEITMVTGALKRQYFLPLRQGIGFYRLRLANGSLGWITDVWSVTQQRRLEQTDLVRLNAHDPRWMVHSASSEAYMPIGSDCIGVYPKPSGSSDVLELTLVEIPNAYASDRDRIKLRHTYQYATVNYAVAEYWASRGDAGEATKHMQLYMDALGLKQQYVQQSEALRTLGTRKEPWPTTTA